jgi:uncharacterized circularly permuted ATP-grasp superfamily protein
MSRALLEADAWNDRPYDEALDDDGRYRPAYEALHRRLGWDPLHPPAAVVERLNGRPLGDDHQVVPAPLALPDGEYRHEIQAGVAQRARALQMFFADVFIGEGQYLRSGTDLTDSLLDDVLASVGTSLKRLRQWWIGHSPETLRFVYAPDLVREPGGRWVVIEDNVGCVGGCADSFFVLQTYRQATGLSREPLSRPDLSHAINLWLDALDVAPRDPGVVAMLSDGDALAAYLPKRFKEDERRIQLVRQLGVQVINDAEFERICQDREARARLKAVVNLGVPSRKTWWLAHDVAFNQLRVPLLNSPGTLLLGHKAFLPFVGGMISFYCGEEPILQSPPTRLLRDGLLPKDLDNWVLKTATGCQGDGVFVLKSQPADRLEEIRILVRGSWAQTPAIIQRRVELSRLRVGGPDSGNTYDVEVRALAYVLGWQHVFVGEHSIGKLVLTGSSNPVQTVFSGGSYVPVVREPTDRG